MLLTGEKWETIPSQSYSVDHKFHTDLKLKLGLNVESLVSNYISYSSRTSILLFSKSKAQSCQLCSLNETGTWFLLWQCHVVNFNLFNKIFFGWHLHQVIQMHQHFRDLIMDQRWYLKSWCFWTTWCGYENYLIFAVSSKVFLSRTKMSKKPKI
jgi:hypothetical protein